MNMDEFEQAERENKAFMEEFIKEEEARIDEQNIFLEMISKRVGKVTYADISQIIKDSDYTYSYRLTEEPIGKYQCEDCYGGIKGYWVNQTTNGGYSGDEFAGSISIKISEGEYLTFNYSM